MSLPSGSSYERIQRDGSLAKQAHSAIQFGLCWWKAWREQSVNRRVFAAMVTVGAFTLLVKLASAAKELLVAYHFGTSDALDAFLIAFLLPQFAINLIAGSLNVAIIPTYIQVRQFEGPQAAQRLLSSVMIYSSALLIAVSVILAITQGYVMSILASGFSPEKLALTRFLYYILLPVLLFSGLATTWGAILNATDRFALTAVAPMVTSLVTVVALVTMAQYIGIFALAVGAVGGVALEAWLVGWGLTRQRISIVPYWHGLTPAVKQVFSQYTPMLAGAFLMGSTVLVGQSMAAMLGPGSVSALAYGSKITTLLLGVASVAVSAAVLPHFSKMVAAKNWSGVRHTLMTYTRLILLITLPLTLMLICFSEPLVRMFFQRGAFTEADTALVSFVQGLYLLQVPVYVLGILIVRLISSLQANHILMWGAVINLSFNILLNYVLIQWMAVAGIALSTSLMYLVSTSFLLAMALRLLKRVNNDH